MAKLRFPALIAVLISLCLFLQYKLWFQPEGLQDMLKLRAKITAQREINTVLKLQSAELLFKINRLKNSSDELEFQARNELGMIKKGEVFYRMAPSDLNNEIAGNPDENSYK